MDLFSVTGKIVVITGASRGIGKAIADGFTSQGAEVVRVSRNSEYKCDLSNEEDIKELVPKILQRYGYIDVLVNNAGVSVDNSYVLESWYHTMKVNLDAVFLLSKLVADSMKSRGGSIINITSIGSKLAFPNNPAYQVSKAAVGQLTKSMAYDYACFGIRVNNLCPGYFLTGMTEKNYFGEPRKEREDRTMLGRWGELSELVGPCIFLASDASSYMTGAEICVDGGWTSKGL